LSIEKSETTRKQSRQDLIVPQTSGFTTTDKFKGETMATAQIDIAELKPLNTKKETAAWGVCSTRQIELLVDAGKFPAPIRLGSHPRWRRSDLLNWLEAQSTNPPA
jgi:predicted DNA-binding transcriptional regulator AlpA